MAIKIYTAKHCQPCNEVMELIKEALKSSGGKMGGDEVKIIDIETDEGFEEFSREVLRKGDGAVPSAYRDGEKCQILVEDDAVLLDCPTRAGDPAPEHHRSSEEG